MTKRLVLLLTLAVLASAIIARLAGLPGRDALILGLFGAGAAAAVGGVATLLLIAFRRPSVALRVSVVVLSAVAAVGAGAATAANRMFISSHDLNALMLILVCAASVGVGVSLWLGQRLSIDAQLLEQRARMVGAGGHAEGVSVPGTRELASVAGELDQMAGDLAAAHQRERALDSSRRELVAWVSHDLRTPLAGIRAMAEALEDGVVSDSGTVARYHRGIRVEVDRLTGLVDDLFELSRINSGTLRLRLERVSLEELVSDTLASAAATARAKGVNLEGRFVTEPASLVLSAQEMSRVFRNLVENAIRHTPSDGSVFVEAGVLQDSAFVSVIDGCGGIPDGDLDRVFDLAFRGEAARTPGADGGAGLGLAIAKGIVDAHAGEIAVENGEAGCRFTVTLPLRSEATA
jgi:signal transduction histidine kinase